MVERFNRNDPQLPTFEEALKVVYELPPQEYLKNNTLKDLFVGLSKETNYTILEKNLYAVRSLLEEKWLTDQTKKSLIKYLALPDYKAGRMHQASSFYESALHFYEKILKWEKGYIQAQANTWSILFARQNIEQAQIFFQNALDDSTDLEFAKRMKNNIRNCHKYRSDTIISSNEAKDWQTVTASKDVCIKN